MLAAVSVQLVACASPAAQARDVADADGGDVWLAWAGTDYGVREPEGAVVVLEVVLRNETEDVTNSTSIEWEPDFAAAYAVLDSDPPAWRVHTAEDGWGGLDTSGVPAGEEGRFRVWFGAAGEVASGAVEAPRIRVIVDGDRRAGGGVAVPAHAAERARLTAQHAFERGRLAALADRVGLVPQSGRTVFPVVVGLAALLAGVMAGGVVAALGATYRAGP